MNNDAAPYGKTVSELQSNIKISGNTISGTLNYVTGYTGFNGADTTEQSGNFLAIDLSATPFPNPCTVELVGGKKGPVALTSDDHFRVFRVTSNAQSIKLTANGGVKTFSLTGLVLTPASSSQAGTASAKK